MKVNHFLFGILIFVAVSCAPLKDFEGVLSYKTQESAYNKSEGTPTYIKYYVKGNKVVTISQSSFGGQKYIRDNESKTGTLLLKVRGQKYALTTNLSLDTIQKHFVVEKTRGKKRFAGINSQKYLITGEYLDSAVVVYLAKRAPSNIINIYGGLKGLPTKYTLILKQQPTQYELVKVEEKVLSEDLFSIPPDYKVMTMKAFLKQLTGG